MKGLINKGATCWINALIQCMRSVRAWSEQSDDPFTHEFLQLVKGATDDTGPFLVLLGMDTCANDAQEAFLRIIDRLSLDSVTAEFKGMQRQTVITPKGHSVHDEEFTIWFEPIKEHELLEGYDGHHISVMTRKIIRVPKILVSTHISSDDTYMGRTLSSIVHWGHGHYIASIRQPDMSWLIVNDTEIIPATPRTPYEGYFAFYKDLTS
jgi:hypothetical protein